MSKFTAVCDERTAALLDELSRSEGVPKAHVVRRALPLLKRAVEAREQGQRLTITDPEDRVLREIVL